MAFRLILEPVSTRDGHQNWVVLLLLKKNHGAETTPLTNLKIVRLEALDNRSVGPSHSYTV